MPSTRDADEAALRRLVYNYARCADTRNGDGFAALFAPGGVLEGPGFRRATPEELRGVPPSMTPLFLKTYHTVLNTIFEFTDDRATGVIYSVANHLTALSEGKYNNLVMYITYHDRYVRTGNDWKFEYRRCDLEFTQNHTAENVGRMPPLPGIST
jgi:hypothetical protein